ncbi:MAG: hypothetical protein M0Q48_04760 [Verrucomicrobia bacterium]|nr:hypothetical protein [Verrucomicrobiota bacterium]
MNSFKNETFEEWAGWKLQYIPPCQEGTNGEGEMTFFNALLACAQRYPERIREWAEMVNEARCQPPFTALEVEHKAQDALRIAESAPLSGSAQYIQNTKKQYKQPTNNSNQNGYYLLAEVIKNVMQKITFDWLWWRSPIVPDSQSAASILSRLYEPGEKLFVTTNPESWNGYILEAGSREALETLQRISIENEKGVCYMPNPITGRLAKNQSGGLSYRCANAACSFKYIAFESDTVKAGDWLKFIVTLPLPIAAIFETGGKSVHTLVKVNASSLAEWKKCAEVLKEKLSPYGADPAMFQIQQMCRLPGCRRVSERKEQRLLYLNPNPSYNTTILEMPLRETRATILARMETAQAIAQQAEDAEPFPALQIPEGGVE